MYVTQVPIYLLRLEYEFEYWGRDKFILISRGKRVKNGDKYLRGRGEKRIYKCTIQQICPVTINYIMPMLTIMRMLKMQLSPATIYAPGRGLRRP